MKYLQKGFQRTIQAIKHHKYLFIILIVLQLLFLTTIFITVFSYQIKIIENAQEITTLMETANYDPESLQAGEPFLQDAAALYQNYQSLRDNVLSLVSISLLIFLIFNGLIWLVTHRLFIKKKSLKFWGKAWLKYLVSSLILLVPFFLICYLIIKNLLTINPTVPFLNYLPIFFIIFYYFLLVAAAFIVIPSWKKFLKAIISCSFKKFFKTASILIINLAILGIGFYLVYQISLLGENPIYIFFSILLIVLIFVLTRIYWIACLIEIYHEKNLP